MQDFRIFIFRNNSIPSFAGLSEHLLKDLLSDCSAIRSTADCRTTARKTIKRFPKIFLEAEKRPKRRYRCRKIFLCPERAAEISFYWVYLQKRASFCRLRRFSAVFFPSMRVPFITRRVQYSKYRSPGIRRFRKIDFGVQKLLPPRKSHINRGTSACRCAKLDDF